MSDAIIDTIIHVHPRDKNQLRLLRTICAGNAWDETVHYGRVAKSPEEVAENLDGTFLWRIGHQGQICVIGVDDILTCDPRRPMVYTYTDAPEMFHLGQWRDFHTMRAEGWRVEAVNLRADSFATAEYQVELSCLFMRKQLQTIWAATERDAIRQAKQRCHCYGWGATEMFKPDSVKVLSVGRTP